MFGVHHVLHLTDTVLHSVLTWQSSGDTHTRLVRSVAICVTVCKTMCHQTVYCSVKYSMARGFLLCISNIKHNSLKDNKNCHRKTSHYRPVTHGMLDSQDLFVNLANLPL